MALTIEEMKILIFISGIPTSAVDVKQNCVQLIESKNKKGQDVRFKDVVEDCKSFVSTRKETKLLTEPIVSVNHISKSKKQNFGWKPKCTNCGLLSHVRQNCRRLKQNNWSPRVNTIETSKDLVKEEPFCAMLDIVNDENVLMKANWINEEFKINVNAVNMIVDTAFQLSTISEKVWSAIGCPKLNEVPFE
jgi:hypothetical protein